MACGDLTGNKHRNGLIELDLKIYKKDEVKCFGASCWIGVTGSGMCCAGKSP